MDDEKKDYVLELHFKSERIMAMSIKMTMERNLKVLAIDTRLEFNKVELKEAKKK